MQLPCILRQPPAALCDLRDFTLAVIVIESRGHSFASDISLRVASVQPQIRSLGIRDLIHVGGHHHEMIRRRRIHVHKNYATLSHKINGRFQPIADCPIAISKLNRKIVAAQDIDQRLEFG